MESYSEAYQVVLAICYVFIVLKTISLLRKLVNKLLRRK